jgi:hypothetical protein
MRDEEYRSEQIPSYGEPAQPVVASRTARHLRMIALGTAVAGLAVVLAVLAVITYPDAFDIAGRGYAVAALVCSLLLLALCAAQLIFWRLATQDWRGHRHDDLGTLSRISFGAHLLAYVVAATTVVVTILGIVEAGWLAAASSLLFGSLVAMLAALVLAGVQYVRASGPPGNVPAHMHALLARSRRSGR